MGTLFRSLIFVIGVLLLFPLLAVVCLLPGTPITPIGLLYLVGGLLLVGGMIGAPWWRSSSVLLLLGGCLLLGTTAYRLVAPPSGTRLALVTFPRQSGPRLPNRIFDEQDIVLFGAQVAPRLGLVSQAESQGLVPALAKTYAAMQAQGVTPLSPFMVTYANQQSPEMFDVVLAEPSAAQLPAHGIIFIHGFGGNFTLQCWLIAQAGERTGAVTVCPSLGPTGDWWSPQGAAILRETLAYLRGRGIEHIYLVGLSNGGIGASHLAQQFEAELAGLVLISGADPDAPITGLPVLVVQSRDDRRIPAGVSERYAALAGNAATYQLFEGDHFLLLKQADQVQAVIAGWIKGRERIRMQ
jgi:pimeloyl-ACP methyl ester carboxylesterase